MIICSCNVISTNEIRDYVRWHVDPSVKDALSFLGWNPRCGICMGAIVEEIRHQINNKSNSDKGEKND